jgi:hypothetical protein
MLCDAILCSIVLCASLHGRPSIRYTREAKQYYRTQYEKKRLLELSEPSEMLKGSGEYHIDAPFMDRMSRYSFGTILALSWRTFGTVSAHFGTVLTLSLLCSRRSGIFASDR